MILTEKLLHDIELNKLLFQYHKSLERKSAIIPYNTLKTHFYKKLKKNNMTSVRDRLYLRTWEDSIKRRIDFYNDFNDNFFDMLKSYVPNIGRFIHPILF